MNKNNPLVSIIIPAYNSEQWIEEAVNSCLNQSYKNIEVIVVNDGSTDGTLSVVQQISDSRLKVFSQMNMGACVARNRGFDESHGEYIKFFDADDYMFPDAIEKQVTEALKLPNDVITYGWTMVNNTPCYPPKIYKEGIHNEPLALITGAPLYPKHIINVVGGFDVRLTNHQDYELTIHCFYLDYKFHFVDICIYGYNYINNNSIRRKPNSLLPILIIFEKFKNKDKNLRFYDTILGLFNTTCCIDKKAIYQYPLIFQLIPFKYLWRSFRYRDSNISNKLFILLSA